MRNLVGLIAACVFALGVGGLTVYEQSRHIQQVKVLVCPAGPTEDSCKPDHIGHGEWTLVPAHP